MYLTGFCLFLSLVLTRTFHLLLDLIHTKEGYYKLKQDSSKEIADLKKRVAELEAERQRF
ncbi:hypothetical protein M378DRAFT_162003, partial [Amanita muscaria Koide BX008]